MQSNFREFFLKDGGVITINIDHIASIRDTSEKDRAEITLSTNEKIGVRCDRNFITDLIQGTYDPVKPPVKPPQKRSK